MTSTMSEVPGLDKLPGEIQAVMLRGVLKHGPEATIRDLQGIITDIGLPVDEPAGVIGPKTIESIRRIVPGARESVASLLRDMARARDCRGELCQGGHP